MADDKHKTEIHIESWSFGSSSAADSAAGDLKAPPGGEVGPGGAGPHVKVFDGRSGAAEPGTDGLSADPDGGGQSEAGDHSKWVDVQSVNIGGHKAGGGAASGDEHEVEYDLVAARASGTDADQPQSGVDVRGWDPDPKKAIIGEAEAPGGTDDGQYVLTSVQHSGAGAGAGKAQLQDFPFSEVGDRDANVQGSANGGLWRTTNFEPDGGTESVGGKMHLEDISLGATDPEAVERSTPSLSEIVVTKVTDSSTTGLAPESPDQQPGSDMLLDLKAGDGAQAMKIDGFLKVPDIPGESEEAAHGSGGGAGKVSVHDISIMDDDDRPGDLTGETPTAEAAFDAFLKLGDIPGESESAAGKMHMEDISVAPSEPDPAVEVFLKLPDIPGEAEDTSGGGGSGAGKVSWSDFGGMNEEDGPSSLAELKPAGGGEQTYLAVKLENVQITSYSLNSAAEDDADGGMEHEDSWEDAL